MTVSIASRCAVVPSTSSNAKGRSFCRCVLALPKPFHDDGYRCGGELNLIQYLHRNDARLPTGSHFLIIPCGEITVVLSLKCVSRIRLCRCCRLPISLRTTVSPNPHNLTQDANALSFFIYATLYYTRFQTACQIKLQRHPRLFIVKFRINETLLTGEVGKPRQRWCGVLCFPKCPFVFEFYYSFRFRYWFGLTDVNL